MNLGPKLWNAITTYVRGKLSLNAFKTAYKKPLLSFYHWRLELCCCHCLHSFLFVTTRVWLIFGCIFFYSVYLIYRIIILSIFFHLAILMWRLFDKPLWASSLHKSILLLKVTFLSVNLVHCYCIWFELTSINLKNLNSSRSRFSKSATIVFILAERSL